MSESLWDASAEYPTWAPGGIYLRTLNRGRVCYDHRGTKMKVIDRGGSSVTVKRKGRPTLVKGRAFTPSETLIMAPDTVVYLTPNRGPPPAPPTPEDEA